MQTETNTQPPRNTASQDLTKGLRCPYRKPEIVTYSEEEILATLGPAQAQYSKPDAGDGGGFM